MTVLVVAEHDGQALHGVTLRTLMAACQISMYTDGQIHVLVTGRRIEVVPDQTARINGVSKVIVADAQPESQEPIAHITDQVLSMVRAYSHVLLAGTQAGIRIAHRVAASLGVESVDNVTRIVGFDALEPRSMTAASRAPTPCPGTPHILTVCTHAFDAASHEGGFGTIENRPSFGHFHAPSDARRAFQGAVMVPSAFGHTHPPSRPWHT